MPTDNNISNCIHWPDQQRLWGYMDFVDGMYFIHLLIILLMTITYQKASVGLTTAVFVQHALPWTGVQRGGVYRIDWWRSWGYMDLGWRYVSYICTENFVVENNLSRSIWPVLYQTRGHGGGESLFWEKWKRMKKFN